MGIRPLLVFGLRCLLSAESRRHQCRLPRRRVLPKYTIRGDGDRLLQRGRRLSSLSELPAAAQALRTIKRGACKAGR
jgi:hypothetical protein